jgi:hypothetical protein
VLSEALRQAAALATAHAGILAGKAVLRDQVLVDALGGRVGPQIVGIKPSQPRGTGDTDFLKMLDQLAEPDSPLSRQWDQEHDRHVAERVLQMAEPDFEATTWRAFRRVALENVRAATVAAELGMSVNAVLLAKSRVPRRLRQEVEGLIE